MYISQNFGMESFNPILTPLPIYHSRLHIPIHTLLNIKWYNLQTFSFRLRIE